MVHLLALLNIKQFSRAVINAPNVTAGKKGGMKEGETNKSIHGSIPRIV